MKGVIRGVSGATGAPRRFIPRSRGRWDAGGVLRAVEVGLALADGRKEQTVGKKLCAGLLAAMAGGHLLRRQGLRWGATDEEVHGPLPGDEIVRGCEG